MKKLLTLGVLVAGVALFAGCMNKPAVEDETTTPTVEETTAPEVTTDEVTPATEETTTDEATTDAATTTTEAAPEATAE